MPSNEENSEGGVGIFNEGIKYNEEYVGNIDEDSNDKEEVGNDYVGGVDEDSYGE